MLQYLIGAWALQDYSVINMVGERMSLQSVQGRLIYTVDGFVSVIISQAITDDPETKFITYSGRYELDGLIVKHLVHVSNVAKFMNSTQKRAIEFVNGQLILRTIDRESDVHEVTWRRLSSS